MNHKTFAEKRQYVCPGLLSQDKDDYSRKRIDSLLKDGEVKNTVIIA